jgi:ribose transport system substrate-binding protein
VSTRRFLTCVAAAGAVAVMTGCGSSSSSSGSSTGSATGGGERVEVGFVAGQVGIPFYTSVECGAKDAAKKFNVDLNWSGATDWDISKEMPFIQAAMRLKPKALIFSPTDSTALVPVTQQMKSRGITPITVDAPLEKPVDTANFQSNHYKGGVAAADAMLKLTGGKGKFLAVGMRPGLPDIDGRVKGFVDTIKQHPGASVLPVAYPSTDSSKAAQMVAAAIRSNRDLAGVYVTHSAASQGASAAIKQAGRQGKIKLVAFDADPQQITDLKRGVYDALVVQEAYNMGFDSVKLAADIARGKVAADSVKHDQLLSFVVATRDNVDDPNVSKYFYKASCSS